MVRDVVTHPHFVSCDRLMLVVARRMSAHRVLNAYTAIAKKVLR